MRSLKVRKSLAYKMKILLFILFAQKCFSFDIPRTDCKTDLKIDNDHYNVTNTFETNNGYPNDIHVDDHGNIFYVEVGIDSSGYYFNARVIEANSTIPQKIPGLPEGITYSIAIDKNNQIVYFSTGEGIFIYNYETQNVTLISKPNDSFNMIFVDKDGNKYVTKNIDGIEEVYLLTGENKIRFKSLEALEEMAIDDKNNFYFIRDDKLFVLKSNLSSPFVLGNVTFDGMAQISFFNEKIFVASHNLTYFHENDTKYMKITENAPDKISAVTFDKNGNLLLGVHGKLLQYKKHHCYLRNNEA
ncbi:uncharacterized protein [Battus philenor]|uniref:uncharacterized protein n=1 Tax=Battus philenor TaxID=42288 RepID=UPI0035D11F51